MFGLGTQELVIILAIVFLIFGAKRLPEIGSGLGKAIKNFKGGVKSIDEGTSEKTAEKPSDEPRAPDLQNPPESTPLVKFWIAPCPAFQACLCAFRGRRPVPIVRVLFVRRKNFLRMGKEPDRMPAPESTPDAENVWNLADLYASPQDPTVSSEMEKSLRAARDFQGDYQGKEIVSLDPPDFLRALKRYEAILEEGLKPFLYGSLLFSEDTQNAEYKSLLQKGKEAWNQLENALLFFRLA